MASNKVVDYEVFSIDESGNTIAKGLTCETVVCENLSSSGAVDVEEITVDSDVYMTGLPTADPGVAGQLWSDSLTVKVSAG